MKINDDHLYHGAALTQIAEHPQFTAINAFKIDGAIVRSAFKINATIGVYLKYAVQPKKGPYGEYAFTFTTHNLTELDSLSTWGSSVFIALICVGDRQICSLPYAALQSLIQARKQRKGADEPQYVILAALHAGRSFRVYINPPGRRKMMLDPIIIARNAFPDDIFS